MREIIIFDLETNGIRDCSVLSISAIKLEVDIENLNVREIGKFDRYYYRNPGEKINFGAIRVNGLTDENISILRKDRNYSKYFKEDYDFEDFDSQFLNIPYMRKFCTMNENVENLKIEGKYGNYKWPKLNETAKYYGIEVDELSTHRSDYDTYLCKEIFVKMLKDNNYNRKILEFLSVE